MEQPAEAARSAKESLDVAFQISNLIGTGLDRHTLHLLAALCDRGVNPESLAALVQELSCVTTAAATSPAGAPRENYFPRMRS